MAPRLAEWQEVERARVAKDLLDACGPPAATANLETDGAAQRGDPRRTRVQDLFPNEASALRLIVARSPASPRRAAERRLDSRSYQPYPALTT